MITALINVHHESDLYQFVVKDNRITRITKFCGDSQFMREMTFDEVPDDVSRLLVEDLNQRYNNHDERL